MVAHASAYNSRAHHVIISKCDLGNNNNCEAEITTVQPRVFLFLIQISSSAHPKEQISVCFTYLKIQITLDDHLLILLRSWISTD